MFRPGHFRAIDEDRIAEEVQKEGFDPIRITDSPGRLYSPHRHAETKLLVFLKGSMEVHVAGEKYDCKPGDKLIIPGNTEHSALAGPGGCVFFWSEKL